MVEKRIAVVVHRSGPCNRAMALLSPPSGTAPEAGARTLAEALHPAGPLPADAGPRSTPSPKASSESLLTLLRRFPKETAPGRGGLRPEHLRELLETPGIGFQVREALAVVVNDILAGAVHPCLNEGELILFTKPTGGYRPIVLIPVLRRLASKCALASAKEETKKFMETAHQFGVGFAGGVEHVAALAVNIVAGGGKVFSVDFANAFNRIHRDAAFTAVNEHFPALAAYAFATLAAPLKLHLREKPGETVEATSGGPQGDPFSPFVFAATLANMRRALKARCAEAGVGFADWWYVGDGLVVVRDEQKADFERLLREEGAKVGCILKCFNEAPADHLRVPLGANRTSKRVQECSTTLARIAAVLPNEPQVALALLRACAAPAVKLRLLARCREDVDWEDVDDALKAATESIVGGTERLDGPTWAQCQASVDDGGCGLQTMGGFAVAFFADAATKMSNFVVAGCEEATRVLGRTVAPKASAGEAVTSRSDEVEEKLKREWMEGARARGDAALVHAHDVAHEWTGDMICAHPKADGPGRISPEAFRRALRNRLGLDNVMVDAEHARVACTRCGKRMPPDHRHAIGCVGLRNTRHNHVRNVIADFAQEAGIRVLKEQTRAQVAMYTKFELRADDDGVRVDEDAPSEDDDGEGAAAVAPRTTRERPCNLVFLHRISDAPSPVVAYDVTIALPDASKGLTGLRARDGDPDWQRALRGARDRKEKSGEAVREIGAGFEPLVFSTNGRPDDRTKVALSNIAKNWSLNFDSTNGEAMRVLRMRLAIAIQRWNGEILRSICKQADGDCALI